MKIDAKTLRGNYEQQDTEWLLELRARGTLTDEALDVLNAVLSERDVPDSLVSRITAEVDEARSRSARDTAEQSDRGLRLLARLIDTAATLTLLLFPVLLAPSSRTLAMYGLILGVCYFLFADALPGGQSLGKKLTGLACVDARTRHPCGGMQSFVRNAVLAIFGWLDGLLVLGSSARRLGDLAGGTQVLKASARVMRQSPRTTSNA